jgi:hypothetical protein
LERFVGGRASLVGRDADAWGTITKLDYLPGTTEAKNSERKGNKSDCGQSFSRTVTAQVVGRSS